MPSRPYVLMNAAVSADGKIAPASRRRVRLGSARDLARMDRLRATADAILIGAGTLRAEDPPLQVRSAASRRQRARLGLKPLLDTIVLSRRLDLPWSGRFFRNSSVRRIVVAPASSPIRVREKARRAAELWLAGGRTIDPRALLRRLAKRGVRRLLIEGGGETYGLFLRAGLMDEIHLTVCPLLLGGRTAPTIFDGAGFEAGEMPRLRLALCRREGDEVYLKYERAR